MDETRDTHGILPPGARSGSDLAAVAGPERIRIWRARDPDEINRLTLEFARECTALLGHDSWALLGVANRRGEDRVDMTLLRHDLDRWDIPFACLRLQAGDKTETALWAMGISRHRAFRIAERFRLEAALYSGPDTRGGVLLFDGARGTQGFTQTFDPDRLVREVSRLMGRRCLLDYPPQTPLESRIRDAVLRGPPRHDQDLPASARIVPPSGLHYRQVVVPNPPLNADEKEELCAAEPREG